MCKLVKVTVRKRLAKEIDVGEEVLGDARRGQAFHHLVIAEDVEVPERRASTLQDGDNLGAEAAPRGVGRALHEQHHRLLAHERFEAGS